MATEDQEKKLEFPYLLIIPYKVSNNKNLTPNAKLHFGCLTALSKKNGYCYATDDQLAEMHGIEVREIKRWNKELEENGHIKRENKNIPYRDKNNKLLWKKERKIYVNSGFSKNFCDGDKNVPIVDGDKNVPSLNSESLNIKKEMDKEKNAPKGADTKESNLKYYIIISNEEEEELLKLMDKEDLNFYKDQLVTHLKSIGRPSKYKSHAATIKNWYNREKKKQEIYKKIKKTSEIEEDENIKKNNIRWLNDKIDWMERTGAKGDMHYNNEIVYDNLLKRQCSLYAKNMIDIVTSWGQFRR